MKNLQIKVPWKYKLESKFTSAYQKAWKDLWNWSFKISDWDRSQKPTDTILANKNWIYIAEFKTIKNDILKISQFEPSQMSAWRKVSWLCWKAIAIIYSIKLNKYKILDFKYIIEKKDKLEMEIKLF